jgi:hypothetical protein
MKLKDEFFYHITFTIGNGESVCFWEDTWLGNSPLNQQYPLLYNIVQIKQVLVAKVMSQTPLNIGFRQALSGNRANRWIHLCTRLMDAQLTPQSFVFKWGLTKSGMFSVKSMHIDYMDGTLNLSTNIYGRSKLLFLHKKVLLTKNNLTKRKWQGFEKCCFL